MIQPWQTGCAPPVAGKQASLKVTIKSLESHWKSPAKSYWLVGQGHPSENMKVNWDDEIPFIYGTIKNGNQTTNQINIFETQQI